MSLSGGTYVIVKIFGESFALPIIYGIVCFVYLILPILGLVVSGLVLGYILFPEKYLKTMKGELDYG